MSAASPSKDVSAKDIVSGIISAANRKMLRATAGPQTPGTGSGKTPKKDSVDSAKSGHSGHHDTIHSTAGMAANAVQRFWHCHENRLIKMIQASYQLTCMRVSMRLPFTVD